MEMSEHVKDFGQLVCNMDHVRFFDQIGTQVNQLIGELRTNGGDIGRFALCRPKILIEVVPFKHILS